MQKQPSLLCACGGWWVGWSSQRHLAKIISLSLSLSFPVQVFRSPRRVMVIQMPNACHSRSARPEVDARICILLKSAASFKVYMLGDDSLCRSLLLLSNWRPVCKEWRGVGTNLPEIDTFVELRPSVFGFAVLCMQITRGKRLM